MDEVTAKKKRPAFGLHLKSKTILYKAYMPFIEGGGLFIPTKKTLPLGQSVGLKLKLLDDDTVYKVKGTVAWVTPETAHGRWKPGIGIQFEDEAGEILQEKIEEILGDLLESSGATNTL